MGGVKQSISTSSISLSSGSMIRITLGDNANMIRARVMSPSSRGQRMGVNPLG
jgi:hypothetical protein